MDISNEKWKTLPSPNGTVIYTHKQTKGRGREQREWVSTSNDIMFTLMMDCKDEEMLRKVGIASMLSMIQTIQALTGVSVLGKWPNDGYVQKKKLFGILVEAEWDKTFHVNIGVGVNIVPSIVPTSTSLTEAGCTSVDEVEVITEFRKRVIRLVECSFDELMALFTPVDCLKGREVRIHNAKDSSGERDRVGVVVGYTHDWKVLIKHGESVASYDREEIVL